MPRGGSRVGSGRKPKEALSFKPTVETFRPELIDGGKADGIGLPDDLPADQRQFWQQYAALAIEKRTLTKHTVPAFRLLCELDAEQRVVKKTIDHDGRTFMKVTVDGSGQEHQELKAHPLKADYAKLAKQVETLMARFSLAPFGKPTEGAGRKTAANPWTQVSGK